MGKPRKQHRTKKFNYNKDRKKAWKKSKKLPAIRCDKIKEAWDSKKSVLQNMSDMGLSADPNKTMRIPQTKELLTPMSIDDGEDGTKSNTLKGKPIKPKSHVVKALEKEASVPGARKMRLSEPEVKYCVSMMEKYGDNYKAMARDERNYYQDTPKQIKRKIKVFMSIPEQYGEYLRTKEEKKKKPMDTS